VDFCCSSVETAARAAIFPLLFLAFTIPIPEPLIAGATQVLKSGSTETVAGLFTLTGTPYHRVGFVFSLPMFAIEVAERVQRHPFHHRPCC
jgi:hypothetical protein